jgi:hypothetical protein
MARDNPFVARRERAVMIALLLLAALGCVLGAIAKPPGGAHEAAGTQLADLVRVICTTALVISLLLGPGIVWRSASKMNLCLGFLPLPGLVLLAVIGGLAWALAKPVGSHLVCAAIAMPILLGLLAGVRRAAPDGMLSQEERRALMIAGCALGLAIARALWALGPEGELFAGSVSRTLEVGDRPDSRIPFHVVQLIANGTGPYSKLGASYFSPYNFSSRGPLAGLASAPVTLLSGGRPPKGFPEQPWSPFDPQGFMAFRIATMAFASTALLSLWSLVRRLADVRTAQFAILLGATTPFLVHEIWFTWPKLIAASLVLLAAIALIDGHPLGAGLLVGFGYLAHPVALLSLPALLLLALWPLTGGRVEHPRILHALKLVGGVALFLILWRLMNGAHYTQGDFFSYLTEAGPNVHASPWGQPGAWLSHRLESLGNTLVPMMLALAHANNPSINVIGGTSPPVIHLSFQYWNTLPFGIGIVFFPLMLFSLWRAWVRWRWPVFVAVIVPLATFAIYWGSYATGMLREGLQTWILTLLAVVAIQQRHAAFEWLRSWPIRTILSLRAMEVVALATVPALFAHEVLISRTYPITDTIAFIGMVGFGVILGGLVWIEGRRRSA